MVGITGRAGVLENLEFPRRGGHADVELAVCGVGGAERQAEQSALSAAADLCRGYGQEGGGLLLLVGQVYDLDLTGKLDHEQPAGVARRGRREHRYVQGDLQLVDIDAAGIRRLIRGAETVEDVV